MTRKLRYYVYQGALLKAKRVALQTGHQLFVRVSVWSPKVYVILSEVPVFCLSHTFFFIPSTGNQAQEWHQSLKESTVADMNVTGQISPVMCWKEFGNR